jgi:tetratricopeptide (TPR) repeat protein
MNFRILSLLAGPVVATLLMAQPVFANTADDQADACASESGELVIGACTWVIRSGEWVGTDLAWAFNNRGFAYYELGEYDNAIQDESQAIVLKPGYIQALLTRAGSYYMLDNYSKAIQDYNQVLAQDSTNAQALYYRGKSKQKTGDAAGGADDIARARAMDPNIGK